MWDDNGQLFLWDYFASFMIKMSIYVFIFDMMSIKVVLQSESPQQLIENHRKRRVIMFTVIFTHTLCIIMIEVYNWIYFIEKDKCIKYGGTGLIYQSIKFVVLVIDLLMVYQLWSFFTVYLKKAVTFTLNQKKKIQIFIQFLLTLNIIWLILRCFVRNLSALFTVQGILIFDYIHTYRYAIQSIFDFINGYSILYGLYNASKFSQQRRRNSSLIITKAKTSNRFDELLKQASINRMILQNKTQQMKA